MLACNDPYDAYQRVEFDAWVKGASPQQLVQICFDQLIIALTTAILASSVAFDGGVLAEIRDDFSDMRRAFGR
jgi:hypothetical protein